MKCMTGPAGGGRPEEAAAATAAEVNAVDAAAEATPVAGVEGPPVREKVK